VTRTPANCDVVGVGANSVDYVYRVAHYPEPGGVYAKIPVIASSVSCGGQVATALCTCAAMGLRTRYIGVTGSDADGVRIRRQLAQRGVDIGAIVVREGANPSAVIILNEASGDRMVLWHRTRDHDLQPTELHPELIASARVVHVDDVDGRSAVAAAAVARAAGIPVTSDIDALSEFTEELIAAVSIPILASHIPLELTGERDMETALRKLRRRHFGLLCVTLGTEGAMLLDGDDLYLETAIKVDAVDTTGAGDVFRGAFIRALLDGLPPAAMLKFANGAAALSCTRAGAIDGVPSREETIRFLDGHLASRGS